MPKKIFIDTNILVDIVTARKQPHVIYSQELLAAAIIGEIDMLDSRWSDYEDATQNTSALSIKADIIATGNTRDFQGSSLRVMTPQQILEEL